MRARTLSIDGNQTGLLIVLGGDREPQPVQLGKLSGNRLDVALPFPLPLESAVKVEWGEFFLLAEVCQCEERGGSYYTGLHLMGGLYEAESLRRLSEVVSAWQ